MRFRGHNALALSLVLFACCQIAAAYKSEIEITPSPLDEPTTKKSSWFGGFKKFFGSDAEATTETTTTTTTARSVTPPPARAAATPTATATPQKPPPLVISHAPLMPLGPRPETPASSPFGAGGANGPQWPAAAGASSLPQPHPQPGLPQPHPQPGLPLPAGRPQGGASTAGAGAPNLPPGFAPYRPQKPQPSGFDLSYSGGGPAGGAGGNQRPGSGLAPLTSSTTSTTTPRPKTPGQADIDLRFGGATTTTTTKQPSIPHKEEFPGLPAPRRPSVKEDFPALPAPKSPTPPSSPGKGPSTPSAWNAPLPTPVHPVVPLHPSPTPSPASSGGHGVAFVPHKDEPTTTVRPGFQSTGSSVATDDEIRQVTEQLYTKETNSQLQLIEVNLQGKTRSIDSADEAPQPLLRVDAKAFEPATIAKMRLLFNNYEQDTLVNEHVTPNERKEENDFVDAVMATSVMRHAMLFLQQKGLVTADPKTHRDLVKELWFTQYSRGQGKIGSSGFEHVFVHEVKNGTIIGFHNWVYVSGEEQAGRFDYQGYMKAVDLGTKGKVLKIRFSHDGLRKPVDSMFVGTSPELELALYTLCFQLRPDRSCPVSLGNSKFSIVAYSWRYRGKSLIGSAFPEI